MYLEALRYVRNLRKIDSSLFRGKSDLQLAKEYVNMRKLHDILINPVSFTIYADACRKFGPMVGTDADVSRKMLKDLVARSADRKYQTEEWKEMVDTCVEDFQPREELYKESFVTYLQPFVDNCSKRQLRRADMSILLTVLARSSPSDAERRLAWKVKNARNAGYRFMFALMSDEAYEIHSTSCKQLMEILNERPWPKIYLTYGRGRYQLHQYQSSQPSQKKWTIFAIKDI